MPDSRLHKHSVWDYNCAGQDDAIAYLFMMKIDVRIARDITMSLSNTQILLQELGRLSDAFGSMSRSHRENAADGIESFFKCVAELRESIHEAARRHVDGLGVDQLFEFQSRLHAKLDDLLSAEIDRMMARRALVLAENAERDSVTSLPNRAAFDRKLGEEVERARRYNRELSLVLFDVDCFKSVNDQFGHPAGDGVLLEVGRILKSSLRRSDAVFRHGGDEFAAICPETPAEAITAVLQRMESNLLAWRVEARLSDHFGISWGVASFPADGATVGELIAVADEKLYDCKRAHHNSIAAKR
jgi:diguanylate cyclase (GGDEF)-like protein